MRRYLTLVCLLCLAIPAGITFSGCSRDPGAKYCNGLGYGLKITDIAVITLQPRTTGISLAFGQTRQMASPTATTCKGGGAAMTSMSWGTTNNRLVDISPTGNLCAGTWNRNSGGGIANYTICSIPNPLPNSGGLPYSAAFITATSGSVVSNPVQIFVHPLVTSVKLVGPQSCQSQGQVAQLDAQACYSTNVGGNPKNFLLCAPPTITDPSQFACPLPPGVASVPSCTTALGAAIYFVGTNSVATINSETNQITAQYPGTTAITASIAGSGSSAGYFSTCPPQSISVTLADGSTSGTINHTAIQNLVTNVIDTAGNTITGLSLDYQSTDPIDISVSAAGAVATIFPGAASITAICQPSICNPSPINEIGRYGTGLSISSNPVSLTYQGVNSNYVWFAAPGQSQYVVPVQLLSGTVGSTVRLPYVPNSMVVDAMGTSLYFGSSHELMAYSLSGNNVTKEDVAAPGVVLAVSPNNAQLLINDPLQQKFYIYATASGIQYTFPGLGTSAAWTPDSRTLYVVDNASANDLPENVAAGITGHTDTLYVFSQNTGWTQYPLPPQPGQPHRNPTLRDLAVTVPSVGAYLSGTPTVAHTWCPTGTVGDYLTQSFYPLGDEVLDSSNNPVSTQIVSATTDGNHILGAGIVNDVVQFSDIHVQIPFGACTVATSGVPPNVVETLEPLTIGHTVNQTQLAQVNGLAVTQINQIVTSPISNLAFVTYSAAPDNFNAVLPYYNPVPGNTGTLGMVGYVTLFGSSPTGGPTAPVAGAFTPDDKLFFVSTAGDNLVHYISLPSLTDTQQIAPGLPACTPPSAGGVDAGCQFHGTGTVVPATAIAVRPRTTT